jgi:hypothetical protein
MHQDAFPLFKKFPSKYKRRRQKQMTNFHEFQSTARRAHAGCVASAGAISGGRFYAPLFKARATHHITSHPTSRPRSHQEEEKQSCEYKSKKATVWPRYPESTSCQCLILSF